MQKIEDLLKRFYAGSERALAQALSLVEVRDSAAKDFVEAIFPNTGKAIVVGVTGAPGVGKSTLVNALTKECSAAGHRVAVLAVDPTSPLSGGAVLGDRIRMHDSASNEKVFIRSMASRGAHGGLAPAVGESILVLDAFGFDYIFVETVGVGQGEIEIVRNAHTVMLVLVPGLGDEVQAMKAGILEVADIFVLNKADYSGTDRLEKELLDSIAGQRTSWKPPIIRTIATSGTGGKECLAVVGEHRQFLSTSGLTAIKQRVFLEQLVRNQVSELLDREMTLFCSKSEQSELFSLLFARKIGPMECAERLITRYRSTSPH